MRDQHNLEWVLYGADQRKGWVSLSEIALDERKAVVRLAQVGVTLLGSAERKALLDAARAERTYRRGIVADSAGWTAGIYVLGDGRVIRPRGPKTEIIVTFKPDKSFGRVGSLKQWKKGLSRLVRRQPLMNFALAHALTAPLLAIIGAAVENAGIEIVGDPSKSKSTALRLAGSVWGGKPGTAAGFSENWLTTAEGLEGYMSAHRDGWLGLNEANLAGGTKQKKELVRQAVFRLAEGEGKNRYGQGQSIEPARLLYLSTSNTPLMEILGEDSAAARAAAARLLTLKLDHSPMGMLDHLPRHCANAGEAADLIKDAADTYYGSCARRFLKRLVNARAKDEAKLRRRIEARMAEFAGRAEKAGFSGLDHRTVKLFGLIYAAGRLARTWGCLPKSWGSCWTAVLAALRALDLHESPRKSPTDVALDQLRSYVRDNREEIRKVSDLSRPLGKGQFETSKGFWLEDSGRDILVVPSGTFQKAFVERRFVKVLRDARMALTEGGKKPKLTKKAPKALCRSSGCRAYFFVLTPSPAE